MKTRKINRKVNRKIEVKYSRHKGGMRRGSSGSSLGSSGSGRASLGSRELGSLNARSEISSLSSRSSGIRTPVLPSASNNESNMSELSEASNRSVEQQSSSDGVINTRTIQSAIIRKIDEEFNDQDKRNIMNRILQAIDNTKKNKESVNITKKNMSESKGYSGQDYNFTSTKDKFLASLNRSIIINPNQINFINSLIKYCNSKIGFSKKFGFYKPKLAEIDKFSQEEYNEIYTKATQSVDKDINNPKFSKVLTDVLSEIQNNLNYVNKITDTKKGLFGFTTTKVTGLQKDRTESEIAKRLAQQEQLLSEVEKGITLMKTLDTLQETKEEKNQEVINAGGQQVNTTAESNTAMNNAKRAADAIVAEGPEKIAANKLLSTCTARTEAYKAHDVKSKEIDKFKQEIFNNTKPPRCKDYYVEALQLHPQLTAGDNHAAAQINVDTVADAKKSLDASVRNSDKVNSAKKSLDDASKQYRPFFPPLTSASAAVPAPDGINSEKLNQFKEIIEHTIVNTKKELADTKNPTITQP